MATVHDSDLGTVVEQYLPLVKHVVFQVAAHFPRHVDREELMRAGEVGLVEAARRFDDSLGVPFGRYAAQRIRGAILDTVRAADWAPRSLRTSARRLEQIGLRLTSELGRTPTAAEAAAAAGLTVAEVHAIEGRVQQATVLALDERLAGDDEQGTLVELLADPSALDPTVELEQRELRAYLRDAVRQLPERHRLVVIGYFLEDRNSGELARFLGVTESRVSQLRSEALEMLREGLDAQFRDEPEPAAPVKGRVARRKANYAAAIATGTAWRDRLSAVTV